MAVSGDTLRNAMGHFATGVTVATFPAEPYHGLTANAVASVSLDPPLVLLCVDHDTESYDLLEGGVDAFALNVLTADQRPLAEHFANMADLDEDPFAEDRVRFEATGAPIFEGDLAYVDCTVDSRVPAGDHTIYIGAVEAAEVLNPDEDPLTFYTGHWGTIDFQD